MERVGLVVFQTIKSGWKGADNMERVGLVSRTAWKNGNMEHGTELVCFPHFGQPGKWAYPIPYNCHPLAFAKHII